MTAEEGVILKLLEQARTSPVSAGVYLMKSVEGEILYIGKAKVLRNRLPSYFQTIPHPIPRIALLVAKIANFEVILTETEQEALLLEATLVKKHKPKFNVRLKDDKAFPYLKIQVDQEYPRIEWTRRVQRDGARYFGPFSSAWSARQVLLLVNETLKLRDCSDNTFRHRSRPCILYQIGRCSAPCVGKISAEGYRESIHSAIDILGGKTEGLIAEIHAKMERLAEEERFEDAVVCRDQIRNLELVTATQAAIQAGVHEDIDVVGLGHEGALASGTILQIRGGKLIALRHYELQNADDSTTSSSLLRDLLTQYYLIAGPQADKKLKAAEISGEYSQLTLESEMESPVIKAKSPRKTPLVQPTRPTTSRVLVSEIPEDAELLGSLLSIEFVTATENPVRAQLLAVAQSNAAYSMELAKRKKAGHGTKALEETQEKLGLPRLPQRIECYDISNFQGEEAVASRVVFVDGSPDKNLYRRYKIKTVQGANDFAMMKEVLSRRFAHRDEALPDLVVVDGGRGQLAQAVAVMEELNVVDVVTVGLAKARTERGFQESEVTGSMERVFIPGRKNPIALYPTSEVYKLLTHVRDEAHRFAIGYHRQLRTKKNLG